ncbi:MAG: HAD family phosphatase [Provencibacterium sp.]|jgi:Cof subfamily protein (haloacid dehalogenase superfamily)|nr:HAD family phosphatase [Provencibacterium sp.]
MPGLQDLLLCSDIDGTTLRAPEGIPPRNIEAVRRFTELGGHFTFATGRVPYMAGLVAEHFPVNAPLITINGALICEPGSMRVLEERSIREGVHETARALVERYDGEAGVIVVKGDLYCPVAPSEESMRLSRGNQMVRTGPWRIADVPAACHKILIMAASEEAAVRIREEAACYEGCFGVVSSGDRLIELIPPDADKGQGLRTVARRLGIRPVNTAAMGDSENDLDLLRAAALSAAPEDAAPAVRACADRIFCRCMDGALAMFIDELIRLYS